MTTPVVLDASAGVELLARTELGLRCQQLLPHDVVPWVPDGLFDTEVFAVLRRWDLRAALPPNEIDAAILRMHAWKLRRAVVQDLTDEAWALRHNITFSDACYVALAKRLGAKLLTADVKLTNAPGLPVEILRP